MVAPATFKSLPFDPLADLAPITLIANTPLVIGTGKDFRPTTSKSLWHWPRQVPANTASGRVRARST